MRIEQHIVAAWASQLSDKIIRDAIDDLQKMDSDEMLSGDSGLTNIWEEVCVQIQGERSFFWDTYVETMESLLAGHVELLDRDGRLALWAVTDEGWDYIYDHHADDVGLADNVPISEEEIVVMLMGKLLSEADDHESPSITRFLYGYNELEDEGESDSHEEHDADGEVGSE